MDGGVSQKGHFSEDPYRRKVLARALSGEEPGRSAPEQALDLLGPKGLAGTGEKAQRIQLLGNLGVVEPFLAQQQNVRRRP